MLTTQQLLLAILANVTAALQACDACVNAADYAGEDPAENFDTHNVLFTHVSAIAEDLRVLADNLEVQL